MNRFRDLCTLVLTTGALLSTASEARTTVEKTGSCEITVTLHIELWGEPNRYYTDYNTKGEAVLIRGEATPEVAAAWKAHIERVWNGPTLEQARFIEAWERREVEEDEDAFQFEDYMKPLDDLPDREWVEEHFSDYAGDTGVPSGCVLNCCHIKFVADVRVRQGPLADATEGWHQVHVVPREFVEPPKEAQVYNETTHLLLPGTIRCADEGNFGVFPPVGPWTPKEDIRRFDSYQCRLKDPDASAYGTWALDPDYSSIGQLAGFLLGASRDPVNGDPQGVMRSTHGFPTEADLQQILDFFGFECDCCGDAEKAWVLFSDTVGKVGDELAACNLGRLELLRDSFRTQLRNLGLSTVPFEDKWELWTEMRHQIDRIEDALNQCNRDPKDEASLLRGPGGTYQVANDSTDVCSYGEARPVPAIVEGSGPRSGTASGTATVRPETRDGSTRAAVGGRQVKLIDPALTDPELPFSDRFKLRPRPDDDPLQCVTGEDGTCGIGGVGVRSDPQAPVSGPLDLRLDVDAIRSVVVDTATLGAGKIAELERAGGQKFTIGSRTYLRLDYPQSQAQEPSAGADSESNRCREKAPAYPVEALAGLPSVPSRAVATQHIELYAEEILP